jgi:hypothetical protein
MNSKNTRYMVCREIRTTRGKEEGWAGSIQRCKDKGSGQAGLGTKGGCPAAAQAMGIQAASSDFPCFPVMIFVGNHSAGRRWVGGAVLAEKGAVGFEKVILG